MLVQHFSIGAQLDYLQPDWQRWGPVVADPTCEANQRNLINQAYHLKLWEDTTGRRVSDLTSIVEFGGGYGALALVARRAGFAGWYTIQDLPEFQLLQRWWLPRQGVEKVSWASGPAQLEADLFIGIYSLSEVPPAERARWLGEAGSYLLLYSSQFAEYDNVAWANELMVAREAHNWRVQPFPARPDYYAIGWKK